MHGNSNKKKKGKSIIFYSNVFQTRSRDQSLCRPSVLSIPSISFNVLTGIPQLVLSFRVFLVFPLILLVALWPWG